jgi:hypothetical protein
MSESRGAGSFWSSIPGILTGIAGVIGAIAAVIVAVHNLAPGTTPQQATQTCPDGSVILATATCTPKSPATQTCSDGSVILATASCPPTHPATQTCSDGSVILATDTCAIVMGPLEIGTNRQGNDFDAFGTPAPNAQICAEMCRTKSNCDAMTYVKSTGVCWLKHGVPAATADADMISSKKQK